MKNIYLLGFMGCGKSTVAAELSKLLPLPVMEMDEALVRSFGCSIQEVFDTKGEAWFREQEHLLLENVAKTGGYIVSCGGGVPIREDNRELLKTTGTCVLLTANASTVAKRTAGGKGRPLLLGKSEAEINALMEKRRALYEAASEMSVETDDKTPAEIASEIVRFLAVNDRLS